jgi:hypothetical protein
MFLKNSVSSELLASAGRRFPRSNLLLSCMSSTHQVPVQTLWQCYLVWQLLHLQASPMTSVSPQLFLGLRVILPRLRSLLKHCRHPGLSLQEFWSHQCLTTPHFTHHPISCSRLLVLPLAWSNPVRISYRISKELRYNLCTLNGDCCKAAASTLLHSSAPSNLSLP